MAKVLTPIAIEKLKPQDKRTEVPDAAAKGLYLVVQPSGAKSFAFRYRHRGKPKKLTLGRFPKMSLAEAREAAREALNHVERGHDPNDIRVAPEQFEMAFKEFLARHVAQYKSRYEVERQFNHDLLPEFRGLNISDITKRDILQLMDKVVDRGAKVMANRLLATLRKFFAWAISRDLIGENPCQNLKLPSKEHSRDRILTHEEISLYWQATKKLSLETDPSRSYERYFQFLLLCGQRRTEVSEMRWDELNSNEWLIPASRSKNGRSHSIPLTEIMINVIGKNTTNSEYVFSITGKRPINNIGRAATRLKGIMQRLAPETFRSDWKPHDLRRTVASEMARLGIYQEVIEKVQNRSGGKLGGIAGVYNRYDYATEKLDALIKWNGAVVSICH